jgi:predicted GIY-YIG superfamily endonuclease
MVNYQNGKIYKIVDNTNGDIYVGSTICSLQKRLRGHKTDSKGRTDISSSKIIFNNDYKIELIENYPCNSLKELLQREQYYIDNTDCINKCNAKMDKKEYNKQYKNDNKDIINFKRRQNRLWGDNLWRIDCY